MHLHCPYHVYHSAGRESRFFSWKLVIFRSNPSLSRPSSWEVWSWCCSHWNGWWAKLSWMLKAAFLSGQDVHDPKIIFPTCKFVECSQVWIRGVLPSLKWRFEYNLQLGIFPSYNEITGTWLWWHAPVLQAEDIKRLYMYIFGGMGNQCPGPFLGYHNLCGLEILNMQWASHR